MTDINLTGIDVEQLRQIFLEEANEQLGVLEAGTLALERQPEDRERLDEVFRAAHSLKSGARTLGYTALGDITHALETLLDVWRAGEVKATKVHVDALLRATDLIRQLLDPGADAGQLAGELPQLRDHLVALSAAAAQTAAAAQSAPSPARPGVPAADVAGRYRVLFAPHADAYLNGMDPLLVLRELRELATKFSVRLDDESLDDLAALAPERAYFRWNVELEAAAGITEDKLRSAFSFVEDLAVIELERVRPEGEGAAAAPASPLPPAGVPTPPPATAKSGAAAALSLSLDASSIRVPTSKIDKIVDLVGELVIAQSALREQVRDFTPAKLVVLHESLLVAERYLRELQEHVMGVRMVPVGNVFARLPRLVRELGAQLGKEIALETSGAETELDKGLAERLGDPILHLVRNALDHGLESPAERVAAGKPPQGVLRVAAYARGGNVFVEVSDDGRGLDRERIRSKGVSRGIIAADAILSDEQIYSIICAPGFSTAAAVTDVSGRGVGLDVVKRNVEEIGGDLAITSEPGHGCRFLIRLPLTLTIMDGLLLATGSEICVLPLTEVAFSLQLPPGQPRHLAGVVHVIDLKDESMPAVSLGALLGVASSTGEGPRLAVVVQVSGYRYALLVDRLLGQAQVVVKSLETHFRRVPGIMGATILGDGRVALIADGQAMATVAGVRRISDGLKNTATQREAQA